MRCPICHPDDPKGPTGELLAWARRVGEQRADYEMYAKYSTARLRLLRWLGDPVAKRILEAR